MSFFDQIGKNATLKEFAANLGFGKSQATKDAEENLEKARAAYGQLEPPTFIEEHPEFAQVTEETPTEMGNVSVNPAYRASQNEQLAALSNLAKNGGKSAASDAALAEIRARELQNAKGQREAVMQNANARGMGGSGAELVAMLSSNQNAQNNENMQDLGVLGQEANTAINAGTAASNIGAGLENQDYNEQASKAAAQDAINRFNAANKTGMSQYNTGVSNDAQRYNTGLKQTAYQNKVQKQAGIAGTNMGAVAFNQNQADMGAKQAGALVSGAVQLGSAGAAGSGKPPAAAPTAAPLSRGGEIPGEAPYPGDTTLNDIVPLAGSPGEVMVPRTLAKHGTSDEIAKFVKNPPKAPMSDHNKEAMLSALHNIRRKRAM